MEKYKKLIHKAWIARGSVINETALLELHIQQIIAEYFCNTQEKQIELVNVILGTEKITFNSKKEILKYIIEKKYPEFIKKNPKWNNDLTEIMQQRNIFAHFALDTRKESIIDFSKNKTIGFAKFKNEQTVILYNDEKMLKLVSMINKYTGEFRILLGLEV